MEGGGEIKISPKYKPLFAADPKNRVVALLGGRGSGKSFIASLFLNELTYEEGHVILFTRYTMTAAEKSIIPEFTGMMDRLHNRQDFNVTRDRITNKISGSEIIFSGIKTSSGNQTANLKSIPGLTTFVVDEGEEFLDEFAFDTIARSVRSKSRPNRIIWIQNPSYKAHFFYKRYIEGSYPATIIHTTYLDNLENLSDEWLQDAETLKENDFTEYRYQLLGEWRDDAQGLLWKRDLIDKFRVTEAPEHLKTFVAVDPAVTANEKSDETGIVVIGVKNGEGYVLDDLSGKYTPNEWAQVAVNAYRQYQCADIVAEVNQGGDMVGSMVNNIDPSVRVVQVRATKGKYKRAEPVYALYQRGLIHHVGYFGKLEDQMVSFNPDEELKSPDRMDALVWGFTEALVEGIQGGARGYAGKRSKPGFRAGGKKY